MMTHQQVHDGILKWKVRMDSIGAARYTPDEFVMEAFDKEGKRVGAFNLDTGSELLAVFDVVTVEAGSAVIGNQQQCQG